MAEDRSLDEFAVGESGDERAEADDADEPVDDAGEPIDADPATPTATWTTDGAACDRCGERIARRWFDDGDLVCAACKKW